MTWGRTRNQVGKPVYRASSYAPNRGQVDPRGYLQREMRKRQAGPNQQGVSKWGNDGKSDTRSGLASRSLSRRFSPQSGGSSAPPPPIQRPNYSLLSGNASSPRGNVSQGNNAQVAAPMPTINVSATGNLELPWEEASNYEAIQEQQAMQHAMQEMQLVQQQQQAEWVRAVQLANEQYEKQKVNRINDSGARGVAFSSAHGQGINEDASAYNNMVNELNTENSNNINKYNLSVNNVKHSWQTSLQRMAYERSVRAAEQAASLAQQQAEQAAQQASLEQAAAANVSQAGNNDYEMPWDRSGWAALADYNGSKPGKGQGRGRNVNGGKNKKGKW